MEYILLIVNVFKDHSYGTSMECRLPREAGNLDRSLFYHSEHVSPSSEFLRPRILNSTRSGEENDDEDDGRNARNAAAGRLNAF